MAEPRRAEETDEQYTQRIQDYQERQAFTNPALSVAQFFNTIVDDDGARERVENLRQHVERVRQIVPEIIELQDEDMPAIALEALTLTHLNGRAKLPQQNVVVEYLKKAQFMLIPSALGMSVVDDPNARCPGQPLLRSRYLKAQTLSYADITRIVTDDMTIAAVRRMVDGRAVPQAPVRKVDWLRDDWCVGQDGVVEESGRIASTFALFSHRLQFNCDIRDFGFLNTATGSTEDGAWDKAHEVTEARLAPQLQAYTLQSIAGLNWESAGKYSLAAWARAYGLSVGLLPARSSLVVPEYKFTVQFPQAEQLGRVTKYQTKFERSMPTVCLNMLSVFGLMHLNKDHTYRPDDSTLERIGNSFLNTLRTGIDADLSDEIKEYREASIRTGAHPFGLGQTYWLALAMCRNGLLMAPLAIRANLSPPPVQRLMIVDATAAEWDGLPMGRHISGLYRNELDLIRAEIARVRTSPPSFSNLFALYGVAKQEVISDQVDACIKSLMPAVFGYVYTTHVTDKGVADGLALAQSLKNVERDTKGLVTTWRSAWEKYIIDLDKQGLHEFVVQMANVRLGGTPAQAQLEN